MKIVALKISLMKPLSNGSFPETSKAEYNLWKDKKLRKTGNLKTT